MIHGRTEEECRATVADVAAAVDLPPPALLWTEREYKKAKVRYFTGDAERWEAGQG
jgi:hypothetical protein